MQNPERFMTYARMTAAALAVGSLCMSERDIPTVNSAEAIKNETLNVRELGACATVGCEIDRPPHTMPTPEARHENRASRSHRTSNRIDIGYFETTCYNLTGITKSGLRAGPGRVAVDPKVIPLGTKLYISHYGEALAADTGGAIDKRIIDIWKSTKSACIDWGRRKEHVWIIKR